MRSIIATAALAAGVMLAGALPASANWTCEGPAYVCGSPKQAVNARPGARYTAVRPGKASAAYGYGYRNKVAYGHYQAPRARSYNRTYAALPSAGNPSESAGGSGYSAGGGIASYYASGSRTASGAAFNPDGLTAAHRSLPFGTRVRVTNRANGSSVIVTINDRGPFVGGRVIDLSRGAARAIGMGGLAPVSLEVLGRG
jgi:rare lipoprotein A